MNNNKTEMKNALEGINSKIINSRRTDKWIRRKNGRNYCHRTEFKKKRKRENEKK